MQRLRLRSFNRSALRSAVEQLEPRRLLAGDLDFGDAPDSYGTLLASNGARHTATPNLLLGRIVDAELDGQPSPGADKDDANPATADDEDGVVFLDPIVPGNVVKVEVTLGAGAGHLNAWLDFNINGAFDAAGEQIFTNILLPGGGTTTTLSFTVPTTATPGQTYARFRLNEPGGIGPTGDGGFGEVEDYTVRTEPPPDEFGLDFGDAPDTAAAGFQYPTLLGGVSGNPARHVITPNGPRLGPMIDPEPDGQPNVPATGDDLSIVYGGIDDEDGVRIGGVPLELVPLPQGAVVPIQINNGGAPGRLNAWFDWNQNGSWGAGEQVATNVAIPAGITILNVPVPNTVPAGTYVYSRFRINTAGGLAPTGLAQDGEVEDYRNLIREAPQATLDYGDAPDTYGTTLAMNGARHSIGGTFSLRLGAAIDLEPDGQPSPNADKDDANGAPDDEDGVTFLTPLVQGGVATVKVVNGGVASRLNAWMDFNLNGVFDPAEQIFTNFPLPAASVNNLNFLVPAWAGTGQTYSRWRVNLQGAIGPTGFGGVGEVEDYLNRIDNHPVLKMDFGDAPNTYRTTLAVNGARHWATPNIRLGARVDAEPDGVPSANANGDDLAGLDDEDGVTFMSPIVQGSIVNVQVVNGGAAARLNAWMDFNLNGVFDPAEQIFTNVPMAAASVNNLNFPVPAAAAIGQTYARFRVNQAGGLAPFGFGGFGEVEDYTGRIEQKPEGQFDFGDAPDTTAALFQYPTMLGGVSGNPARHAITPHGPMLGPSVDAEPDGQQNLPASGDDIGLSFGGIDDENGVTVGGVALELVPLTLGSVVPIEVNNGGGVDALLQAWFDWNQNGSWGPGEQVAANVPVPAGTTIILNVGVPNTVTAGSFVYSRFRLSTIANLGPGGAAKDGEVEDYRSPTRRPPQEDRLDFGDAPEVPGTILAYPTTLAGPSGDPARHIIVTAGPRLGPMIDPEPDGQPNLAASGDDTGLLYGGIDDEDGVTIGGANLETVPLVPGTSTVLEISNPTGVAGLLNAWFDWNQNGNWEAAEQVALDVPAPPGVTFLPVLVPAGLKPDSQVYSRFRIDTAGGLKPTGLAKDGEVEDYVNRVIVDNVPPFVVDGTLEYETHQAVRVTFSEPLNPASVQAADLVAKNLDDGTTPVANSVALSAGNTIATWVFNTPGSYISDGDYSFDLPAGSVADLAGNGLAPAFNLSGAGIFFNAADMNRDRKVDVIDLGILATNWQMPGTFSDGDSNYDGVIDVIDLGILATKWQQVLPRPLPPGQASVFAAARAPTRVATDILLGTKGSLLE